MKLEEKNLLVLANLKSFFLRKVVCHLCNFRVLLPTNALKRSTITDDRLLFATLKCICKAREVETKSVWK